MKGAFDAYVLWPKKLQNWIVDQSTARDLTLCTNSGKRDIEARYLPEVTHNAMLLRILKNTSPIVEPKPKVLISSILWATSEKGDYSLIFQKLIKIYFQKYQKKCSVCDKPIEGTYFTKDEKIICDEDYRVCHFTIPKW